MISKSYVRNEVVESKELDTLVNVILTISEKIDTVTMGVSHIPINPHDKREKVVSVETIPRSDYLKHERILLGGLIEMK